MSWPQILGDLTAHRELDAAAIEYVIAEIASNRSSDVQIAGLLVGLRTRGETATEVHHFAQALLRRAVPFDTARERVLDIVGTGGDGLATVNISTMASVVAAAAGAWVVKHGNRAASGRSGSADVLEALGVALDIPPGAGPAVLDAVGITFCFATQHHPALRHAATVRKQLAIPSVFNILGPLTNPALPQAMLVGATTDATASLLAQALKLGGRDALVVRGDCGMDEVSLSGPTNVWIVTAGAKIGRVTFEPEDVGLAAVPIEALRGGSAQHNAEVFRHVLSGNPSSVSEIVALNAAFGLAVYEGLSTNSEVVKGQIRRNLTIARQSITSGAALRTLDSWSAHTAVVSSEPWPGSRGTSENP